jgi:3-hydroxyacyl-CoA dehydrogenase/enoyl-CoA hydratase/3-hydroxybutyryl-CoA epimerase
MGLPEVMLGIFPGWGGMLRLPQRIGAPAALDLMLTGKTLDARRGVATICIGGGLGGAMLIEAEG